MRKIIWLTIFVLFCAAFVVAQESGNRNYEPLDASVFDLVINPLGIEPMVQFTLYLRLQYDLRK